MAGGKRAARAVAKPRPKSRYPRCLVVGIDGAERRLLRRWAEEGALATFARLSRIGARGNVVTPAGLGDDAVWASFWTGQSVGDHGRYFWNQPDRRTAEPISLYELPSAEPFWRELGRRGHRVAVLDVPKCPVSSARDGIHLCDWLVHGRSHPEPASHPPELAAAVVDRFGAAPPSRCAEIFASLSDDEIRGVTAGLLEAVAMKERAARHYLATERWTLFITVFKEAHCASHMLWHLVEPDHPRFDPERDRRLGEPVKAVFRAIDAAIGRLVEQAGPDTNVLLFSPLGMAPNVTGNHLLAELLERFDRDARANGVDVPTCWTLPHNEASGAIRVNVLGREPHGALSAGAKLEAFRDRLAAELASLTDADTGRAVVDQVIHVEHAFPGRNAGLLPDLLVVWTRERPFRALRSRRFGDVRAPYPEYRPGNHVPGGVYVLSGPGIEARAEAADVPIADLARLVGRALEAPGLARP